MDAREARLFQALDIDNDHHVRRRELEEMLRLAGLTIQDSRLRRSRDALLEAERSRAPAPVPLRVADYDRRTPLHLAASEGRVDALRFLLDQGVPREPRDRWGFTPLDDAKRHGHGAIAELLSTTPS